MSLASKASIWTLGFVVALFLVGGPAFAVEPVRFSGKEISAGDTAWMLTSAALGAR